LCAQELFTDDHDLWGGFQAKLDPLTFYPEDADTNAPVEQDSFPNFSS